MKIKHNAEVPLNDVTMEGAAGCKVRWLVGEADAAPNFAMRQFELEPGGHTPRHFHPYEHEIFVLEGDGVIVDGDQQRPLRPGDVVLVFILPPSLSELERRLRSRNTDAPEVIDRRLRVARDELRHYQEYDYIIVNDDLDRAYDVLRSVYVSETFRCARQRAAAEAVLSGQQVLNIGGRAVTGPEGA